MAQKTVTCEACGMKHEQFACDACGKLTMAFGVLVRWPEPETPPMFPLPSERGGERYDACSAECREKLKAAAEAAGGKVLGEFTAGVPVSGWNKTEEEPRMPAPPSPPPRAADLIRSAFPRVPEN